MKLGFGRKLTCTSIVDLFKSSIVDSGNETLTGGLNTNNQSQINKHASFDLANSSAKYEDDYEQMSNNDQSKRFSQCNISHFFI